MKKILSAALALILCAALFSCGTAPAETEAATEAPKKPSEALIGVWIYDLGGYVYTFNSDGTGSYDAGGTLLTFNYTATDSEITFNYDGNTEPTVLSYEIADNLLNIKDSFGNDTFYVRRNDG